MRHSAQNIAALALFLCALAAPSQTQAAVRTVALSGRSAPGVGDGAEFFTFWPWPVINNSGQTAFRGFVAGVGLGIWSEGSGSLELAALKGDQAPGAPDGFVFDYFLNSRTVISDAGQTVFGAGVISEGDQPLSSSGVWLHDAAGTRVVILHGAQVPGYPADVVYDINSHAVLNDNGQMAMAMDLKIKDTTTVVEGGIWTMDAGGLNLLVDATATPPGEAAGVEYRGFGAKWLALNGNGDIAINAGVAGPGVVPMQNERVWVTRSGELELVVASGEQAPGTADGVTFWDPEPFALFQGMYKPSLNDAGQTAFFASLAGSSVDGFNNTGVWSEGSGSLALVAREGDAAPGTEPGTVFYIDERDVDRPPLINAVGKTAFDSELIGPTVDNSNNQGVWSDAFGELELVARGGDPAPGTEDGVMFDYVYLAGLNALGQALIVGTVVGDGVVTDANHRGVWAQDVNGELVLIARTGDQLEVAPGDFRTLKMFHQLGYSGNEDGRASSFNDRGEIVFAARFTDGSSGVFVSDRVAIPEPTTAALAMLALTVLAPRRAPRR